MGHTGRVPAFSSFLLAELRLRPRPGPGLGLGPALALALKRDGRQSQGAARHSSSERRADFLCDILIYICLLLTSGLDLDLDPDLQSFHRRPWVNHRSLGQTHGFLLIIITWDFARARINSRYAININVYGTSAAEHTRPPTRHSSPSCIHHSAAARNPVDIF